MGQPERGKLWNYQRVFLQPEQGQLLFHPLRRLGMQSMSFLRIQMAYQSLF